MLYAESPLHRNDGNRGSDSRRVLLILAFTPEQVERHEPRLTASKQQITKLGFPLSSRQTISPSSTIDFTGSSEGRVSFNTPRDLNSLSLRGEKSALSVVDSNQRTEAVPLDLEEPIRMAERSGSATERHGLEMREGHWIGIKDGNDRTPIVDSSSSHP